MIICMESSNPVVNLCGGHRGTFIIHEHKLLGIPQMSKINPYNLRKRVCVKTETPEETGYISRKEYIVADKQFTRKLMFKVWPAHRFVFPQTFIEVIWNKTVFVAYVVGYSGNMKNATLQYSSDLSIEERVDLTHRKWKYFNIDEKDPCLAWKFTDIYDVLVNHSYKMRASKRGQVAPELDLSTKLEEQMRHAQCLPFQKDIFAVYNVGDGILYEIGGLLRPGVVVAIKNFDDLATKCKYKVVYLDDGLVVSRETKWIDSKCLRLGLKKSDALIRMSE
jgi:hypothetical protein